MRPLVGPKLLSHEISWQICEDGLLSPAKKEGEDSGEPPPFMQTLASSSGNMPRELSYQRDSRGCSLSSALLPFAEMPPDSLFLTWPTAPRLLLQGGPGTLVLADGNHWVGSNGDQLPAEVGGVKANNE